MSEAWLVAGLRTPIGKFLGAFANTAAPQLAAVPLREMLKRTGVDPADVDEVILGEVLTAGVGQAPARQAALAGGLPDSIAALTINKVCGSGLKAVMLASQAIRAGDARIVVAGGMENMSRAPHLARTLREGNRLGPVTFDDALIQDGLWCAFENQHMGNLAEWTASECRLSRSDLDEYANTSQARAAAAIERGDFAAEIVPVPVTVKGQTTLVSADEGPRKETTLASLAKLKPAFDLQGVVTAGNASTLSDGAATLLVVEKDVARGLRTPWKARVVSSAVSGGPPRRIFLAPVEAMRKALDKAGLSVADIDRFEINEAFASQMLACIHGLSIDRERVNVCGGSIALGHPIGASGARVLVTLLHTLHRENKRYGLASLCLGGGNAVAMVVERTDCV